MKKLVILLLCAVLTMSVFGTVTAEEEKTVLYICSSGVIENKIAQWFMNDNPDIVIEFVESPKKRADYPQLLGDLSLYSLTQPDLLLVSHEDVDIRELSRKGYIAPISSERLKARVDKMYSFVGRYVYADRQLMGYPVEMLSRWMSVDEELLSKYDLGEPAEDINEWIEQLERYLSQIREETDGASGYLTDLECRDAIMYIVMLSIQDGGDQKYPELPDLTKPELVSLTERLVALVGGDNRGEPSGAASELYDIWDCDPFINRYNDEDITLIKPFTLKKGKLPTYEAIIYYYVINPNSKNKEIAEKFLEYYDENVLDTVSRYQMYPIHEEGYEYGRKVITQEEIKLYREASWDFSVSEYYPIMLDMNVDPTCVLLMKQLLHGEITAEQYLTHLQERMEEMISLTK